MEARLNNLEERLGRLEEFASDAKERLGKIALRLEQTATKTDIAEIRADMHKTSADIARWMIATVVGLFLGFGGLFFVMNNAIKSAVPSAASIVIYPQPAGPPPTVIPP